MGYGTLDVFFNGLETLLGPPQMMKDPDNDGVATIKMGMQLEHTSQKDASEPNNSWTPPSNHPRPRFLKQHPLRLN